VTPRKAQDVLVSALAAVTELDWTCNFVGALDRDPPYAARVVATAAKLDERVNFAGPLVGPELDACYAAADLLVLPSLAETYGMVVTEALARGVPVLATEVGGVPEALGWVPGPLAPQARADAGHRRPDPAAPPERPASEADAAGRPGRATPAGSATASRVRPGLLIPPGDPRALVDALQGWLTRADLRASLRAAARARRSTLDGWDTTARALADALEAL
jgi:glycosyltransferase involved in cell wall biosynthesis